MLRAEGCWPELDEIRRLMANVEAAIAMYEPCMPYAKARPRSNLIRYTDWNVEIAADLRRRFPSGLDVRSEKRCA